MLWLLILFWGVPAQAAFYFGSVRVSPNTVVIGTPTKISVMVSIGGDSLPDKNTLVPGGVTLERLQKKGPPILLGTLHDDGKNGDLSAGDFVFTFETTLKEASAGEVKLQVSARFLGQPEPVHSQILVISVEAVDSAQKSLATLARCLAAGDRSGALRFVEPGSGLYSIISTGTQDQLKFLAASYGHAKLTRSEADLKFFESPVTRHDGTVIHSEFSMVPDGKGQWVINE
jgi:hypothetical protein